MSNILSNNTVTNAKNLASQNFLHQQSKQKMLKFEFCLASDFALSFKSKFGLNQAIKPNPYSYHFKN